MNSEVFRLIKPSGVGKERIYYFHANRTKAPYGGLEGDKFFLTPNSFELPRLFYKERKGNQQWRVPYLIQAVRLYDRLRSLGYPVPGTVRYIDETDHVGLALSDETQNGEFETWGVNDSIDMAELRHLRDMALTNEELDKIESEVYSLAQKATQDGILLTQFFYHLKFKKMNRDISIILLDVCPKPEKVPFDEYTNNQEAEGFMQWLHCRVNGERRLAQQLK